MSKNSIIEQIKILIEKSNSGDIPWTTVNANVNRWIRVINNRTFTTTIQRQPIKRGTTTTNNWILTILGTNPNEVILQINTSNEATFKELLSELYSSSNLASQKNSAEILNKLMNDL